MILVTLKNGRKWMVNEAVVFGIMQISAAEKAAFFGNPDPQITPEVKRQMMLANTGIFTQIQTPQGPAEYHAQEHFDEVACQMDGIELTLNDESRLKLAKKSILHAMDLVLADRKDSLYCYTRIQTPFMTPRGQVRFDVRESVDYIASAMKKDDHEKHIAFPP